MASGLLESARGEGQGGRVPEAAHHLGQLGRRSLSSTTTCLKEFAIFEK